MSWMSCPLAPRGCDHQALVVGEMDKLEAPEERGSNGRKAPEMLCVLQACFGRAADDTYLFT